LTAGKWRGEDNLPSEKLRGGLRTGGGRHRQSNLAYKSGT
jgi:hypothetical protein